MKFRSTMVHPVSHPDRVLSYFRAEWLSLLFVTIFGLIYNIGLLAGPLYEGRLAQCLYDILRGRQPVSAMSRLALTYVGVIAVVQVSRFLKRLYVRVFANNTSRSMKEVIYGNLIHESKSSLESQDVGAVMTKAVLDADACAEGMRKFTTEIFDTGVALVSYIALLLSIDWRLGLLCLIFPPISYFIANRMKGLVTRTNAEFRESSGRLSAATMDRVSGALTYRVFGCEPQRDRDYEAHLSDYEKRAVLANIWAGSMPPLYNVISMSSVLFIFWFGTRNVAGTGWSAWDIAAFTAFLSCYTKLSVKSSHAAKLFNAVQKAEVSWRRIVPLMKRPPEETAQPAAAPALLAVKDLGFSYPQNPNHPVFSDISFAAAPGTVIGVTGPVASGKSTFGKAFLCEQPYKGSICFAGKELSALSDAVRQAIVGYLGHDPELMSDTIRENVLMGTPGHSAEGTYPAADDALLDSVLRAVCLDREIRAMPDGADTRIGSGGVRLSGGQQQRLALARTLAHPHPVLVLDDPFSALDRPTEEQVYRGLRQTAGDSIILLLSHRLYLFPQMDQVIWMEQGRATVSTHRELMRSNPEYRKLYEIQTSGSENVKGGGRHA